MSDARAFRLAWITDPHFDHSSREADQQLVRAVCDEAPDLVVISGDVATAPTVAAYLDQLVRALPCPAAVVLGNHDYWDAEDSIAGVRFRITGASLASNGRLMYLPRHDAIPLTARTALVGCDGWADGRLGDYLGSPGHRDDHPLILRYLDGLDEPTLRREQMERLWPSLRPHVVHIKDYDRIPDFRGLGAAARLENMQRLSAEDVARVEPRLIDALARYEHVVLVTHVPPFAASAVHPGGRSTDGYLPHMTNAALGTMLTRVMSAAPDQDCLVLCGHTHGDADVRVLPNLRVLTGRSTYGAPSLHSMIDCV